ncbi:precorrin-8X methylmutase [Deferrisoma camini]|uniref:precorrin-8X methylmutase n=1 Tax=Deferrisoma camini TaxID=1035120 RepID=UPI0004B9E90A|nr:precorrin-8X methylmutase [Deferrisoma camini]
MPHAVLFLAHGSRSADANRFVLERVTETRARLPGWTVEAAFLQLAQPGLDEALGRLAGAGAHRVAVVPLFLAPGNHVSRDLPARVRRAAARHPGLEVVVTPPLGVQPRVWAAAAELAQSALTDSVPPGEPPMQRWGYDVAPHEIEIRSFEIIESLADLTRFAPAEKALVQRVIHATGDPSFADLLAWSPGAVEAGVEAFRAGAPVVTDVEMARAGVSKARATKLGSEVHCFLNAAGVPDEARHRGLTRSIVATERAAAACPDAVFAFGNAPTALFRLLELVDEGRARPRLVIGVVVGFVGAAESKEALMARSDLAWIAVRGNKGGSNVAAACVNALMKTALEGAPA